MKQFVALIPGYGVPKDILTDKNYATYLAPCFNMLFDTFRDTQGTIVVSGGRTDVFPPYRRTEAGEMKRWLVAQIALARKASGMRLPWKIALDTRALTSVENVINFKPFVSRDATTIIFGDKTRMARLKKFFRAVAPRHPFTAVPIDFDMSTNRYRLDHLEKRESTDLKFGLEAITNPKVRNIRREFAQKKLKMMREIGPGSHEQLPEILEKLKNEFAKKYAKQIRR